MNFVALGRQTARSDHSLTTHAQITGRVRVHGKFLVVDGEKFWVRGVTYGTFGPDGVSSGYPAPEVVSVDFSAMAAAGFNSVRVYTPPPRWLLDAAARNGLRVAIGLPWEQHVSFLDDAKTAQSIVSRIEASVRETAGHPAVLCYAIGNEIPSSIVRWYGRQRIVAFLRRVAHAV